MPDGVERVSTDALMRELRRRIGAELPPEVAAEFEAIERFHAALTERHRLIRSLLRDDIEPDLKTFVRFESHRERVGGIVNFVKRRVLFPLNYWLFELCRDNFERQNELNAELLASIELLVLETDELRRRLDRRDSTVPSRPAPELEPR